MHDGLSLKEAIVDMSGPGAQYSPFGATLNLVVSCSFAADTGFRERTDAATRAALRAAAWVAEAARRIEPDRLDVYEFVPSGRPRIGFLCFLMTEGEVHRSYVYGANIVGLPTVLHPNELFGGAVVSGDYHTACFRNVTYLQQNNPVCSLWRPATAATSTSVASSSRARWRRIPWTSSGSPGTPRRSRRCSTSGASCCRRTPAAMRQWI